MKMEKAIKWLNNFKVCLDNEVYCDDNKKLNLEELREVITLLQEGEKYKKIVEEFEKYLEPGVIIEIPDELRGLRPMDIITYQFKKLKEKYFPKPISIYEEYKQKIIGEAKELKRMGCRKSKDYYYYIGAVDTLFKTESITQKEHIELSNLIQEYLKEDRG